MTKPKPKADKDKLSTLGNKIERVIVAKLDLIERDMKKEKPEYTLTDLFKVVDRGLKLEAIKAKANDEEGDFFTKPGGDDE